MMHSSRNVTVGNMSITLEYSRTFSIEIII